MNIDAAGGCTDVCVVMVVVIITASFISSLISLGALQLQGCVF